MSSRRRIPTLVRTTDRRIGRAGGYFFIKEFTFRDKRYFLETVYHEETGLDEMYIFEASDTDPVIARFFGKDFDECTDQFEEAKIFDGQTIYDVEDEIEVLFG